MDKITYRVNRLTDKGGQTMSSCMDDRLRGNLLSPFGSSLASRLAGSAVSIRRMGVSVILYGSAAIMGFALAVQL